jgi:hypothetical protein
MNQYSVSSGKSVVELPNRREQLNHQKEQSGLYEDTKYKTPIPHYFKEHFQGCRYINGESLEESAERAMRIERNDLWERL